MKKKYTLTLAALVIATAASATVLRVNNNAGSTAPYSDLSTALNDAVAGDTIMVEGSETSYGDFIVTKRIVLMGPGYMQVENGLVSEGVQSAKIGELTLSAEGVQVQGMQIVNPTSTLPNHDFPVGQPVAFFAVGRGYYGFSSFGGLGGLGGWRW